MSILELTAVELGKKIKDKEITVVEATKAALEQIKAVESDVHGYVSYDEESALKRAEEVQKGIDDGTYTGPLAGVPMAIKDNICTKGYTTTCSSKILENFVPTYSAQAVENLIKEGVVFLGKTMNVQNYLSAMDLFLLPSLHEGLPLVLVEAQASGLTCVVSDTVAREADLTETSWYLPISTVEPWSKVIRDKNYLGKNRNERSKQNIERIKEKGYDLEQNANLLRQIYIDSCEER